MKVYIIELINFFRNNILKLIFITTIFAILFLGVDYARNNNDTEKIDDLNENNESRLVDEDISPASFQFYVEKPETQNAYTNDLLIEQYILLPDVLKEVSNLTNTNLFQLVEETNALSLDISNIIGINRDPNSHRQVFYVNIGQESGNLQIANFYYNFITEGNIPFLNDKNISTFRTPYIVDVDVDNTDELTLAGDGARSWNIIISLVKALIFGSFISIISLAIFNFFSQKLNNYFFYTILDEDYFILIDNKLNNNEELFDLLACPRGLKSIVIEEKNLNTINQRFEEDLNYIIDKNNIEQVTNFINIVNPDNVEQLIYIIKEGETTREWYNRQRKIEKSYDIPVIIVQVNKF